MVIERSNLKKGPTAVVWLIANLDCCDCELYPFKIYLNLLFCSYCLLLAGNRSRSPATISHSFSSIVPVSKIHINRL